MPNTSSCRIYDEFEQEKSRSAVFNLTNENYPDVHTASVEGGVWSNLPTTFQGRIGDIAFGNLENYRDVQTASVVGGVWCNVPPTSIKARFKSTAFVDQDGFEFFIIDPPKNRDSLTQENLVNNKEEQVQEVIFWIKTSRLIPYRERLARRLLELYYDAKEEDPECVGIVSESLRSFNDFLHLYTNIKCPTVSLTPDNNIYASWRLEHNRVFSIHFLPNADVRFVMFKPNEKHPERKIRISGSATIDTLKLEDWILE
jgi:hypothetical protein